MAIEIRGKDAWVGIADCKNCDTRELSLFACLSEDELLQTTSYPVAVFGVSRGSTVYQNEEVGSAIYTLKHGLIKLERLLPDGNRRIVRLIRSNDVFGLEVLVNSTYEHDAVVLEDAKICKIPCELVNEIAKNSPQLYKQIMQRWQAALSETDNWLTDLLSGSARQRVARLILRLRNDDDTCALLSRDDMGSLLSITTETASRVIAEFKRLGSLQEIGNNQFHCNVELLNSVSK